jgi:hypothetical protein
LKAFALVIALNISRKAKIYSILLLLATLLYSFAALKNYNG